jgi:hypothetical protein
MSVLGDREPADHRENPVLIDDSVRQLLQHDHAAAFAAPVYSGKISNVLQQKSVAMGLKATITRIFGALGNAAGVT